MNFSRFVSARCAAVAMIAALSATLPQLAGAQTAPTLAGKWNLVPEKSTAMPGPPPKSGTLTITDKGEMTLEGVNGDGKPIKSTFDADTDGKNHPISGVSGADTGVWSKNNELSTSYRYFKGKSIAALGTRTLSADGSTLTFREKNYDSNGKELGNSVTVFVNPDVKVAVVAPPAGVAPAPQPALNPQETAAAAALAMGNDDEAIRQYTAVLSGKQTPMFYYDHVSRGIAYVRKGQQEQALADFDEAVKLKPEDNDARFRRGGTRVELKQYKEAIEDLSAVIQADPMNAAAYSLRSFAYYKLEDSPKGGADIEKACMIDMKFCP